MSKRSPTKDALLPEYDFASMKGGVRGKYVARLRKGSNIVVLEPEIAAAFPSDAAVNEALRGVLNTTKAVRRIGGLPNKALQPRGPRSRTKNRWPRVAARAAERQALGGEARIGYSPHMTFSVQVDRESDGRWIAEVAELPGVHVYGDSQEQAQAKAQALALRVLADRLEHGEAVPFESVLFSAA